MDPRRVALGVAALLSAGAAARAAEEIIHLKNGDVFHGDVVAMTATSVTIKTAYGRLIIPKNDLEKVVYEDDPSRPSPVSSSGGERPDRPDKANRPDASRPGGTPAARPPSIPTRLAQPTRPLISLEIRGRSFWYAWQGSAVDPRIRLRLSLGGSQIAELIDAKPDTVDGNTIYNSFTFSPTDSRVVSTAEGYACTVEGAVDGKVLLRIELPQRHPSEEQSLEMLYQINEGTEQLPRWLNAVTRSFPVHVKAGKQAQVIIQQDSSKLDFSGLVRKKMKNVETFTVNVVSSELRDRALEPTGSTR